MSGELGGARCLAHPDQRAERACARCGDFMCLLCGPLEPLPLCPRCMARTTLEWEERGEQSLPRAFLHTWLECVSRPSQVGARLFGTGHVLSAHAFSVVSFMVSFVPLALVLDALLFTFVAPSAVGFPRMSVLSLTVALATSAIVAPTLAPMLWTAWALCVWGLVRAMGVKIQPDGIVRSACYGASACAFPGVGIVLLPLALVQQALMTSAHVARHGSTGRVRVLSICALAWGLLLTLCLLLVRLLT